MLFRRPRALPETELIVLQRVLYKFYEFVKDQNWGCG
jgi:hypothetical protein